MSENPDYYTWHPVAECYEVVSHFPYNIGVAMAYLWRAGRKTPDPRLDLRKAIRHIEFEIERLGVAIADLTDAEVEEYLAKVAGTAPAEPPPR